MSKGHPRIRMQEPPLFTGFLRDITQRKQAEESLREQADMINLAQDAIIIHDYADQRITLWTRGAERMYGWRSEEAIGQPIDQLIGQDPKQRESTRARLLSKGEFHGELKLVVKDGREVAVDAGITLIRGEDSRPRSVLSISTDITEQKRAKELLHEQADIIHRAHDAVIVRDFETDRVTIWNRGAERLYGWTAEEALGRPLGDLIFAESSEREALIKCLISTGEFHGQIKHRAKDGQEVIVDARVTLIQNDDGTPRSVLGINTDVTEQKKLEVQLLRAQRLESIGTLASGLAHDLNNILTPILVCVQTLRTELAEKDRQSALSLIEESAQRGTAVLKQVLTFARGVEGERVLIKPSHLIEEMTDIARKTFPQSIEINSRYPQDLWSIEGDPTQLHQVLLNLFVNARDAMPEGGLLTFVAKNFTVDENYASMTPGAKAGPCVVFSVSDTGRGMPRATIDKIFDPFFTTKEVGKGTGLGLSMALGIVKSHGGFISVDSETGKGTTFKIFMPAAVSEENLQQSNRVAPGSGLLWPIAPRNCS
jgi:two-component system cell cycle sensor histidine kinase/response regulator CckA